MNNLNHIFPFFNGKNKRHTPYRVFANGLQTPQTTTHLKKTFLLPSILRGCLLVASIVLSTAITHAQCTAPVVSVTAKILPLTGQAGAGFSKTKLIYRHIFNRITDSCDGDLTFDSTKVWMERVLPTDAASPLTPRTLIPNGTTTGTIGNARLTDSTGNAETDGLTFTCMDVGRQFVRVWARNAAGNWHFAVSTITIQDNDGICESIWTPSVTIATETGSPVKDVLVTASFNGLTILTATTSASGVCGFFNLSPNATYQLRADKNNDADRRNGVTTLDLALMSKHNLGIELLNSPYKIIAADVNKDGEVDALDMLLLRRFILGLIPNFPAGSFWRFIDKAYRFNDPSRPFDAPFPESLTANRGAILNFIGVKLGDVNNSFDAIVIRDARTLTLNVPDIDLVAGKTYTVPVNAAAFNAATLQGTFVMAGATIKTVTTGNLNNLSNDNIGLFTNAVTVSWNGKIEPSAHLLSITFTANTSGKLRNNLTFNSHITKAEASDPAGELLTVGLAFDPPQILENGFALYQNTPNPAVNTTDIGFNLTKDGPATLTIYTMDGCVVRVIKNDYPVGYNVVQISQSDLKATGVFYYRLETPDNAATRRMVFIE